MRDFTVYLLCVLAIFPCWSLAGYHGVPEVYSRILRAARRPESIARWRSVLEGRAPVELMSGLSLLKTQADDEECTSCVDTVDLLRQILEVLEWDDIKVIIVDICKDLLLEGDPNSKPDIFCPGLIQLQGKAFYDVMSTNDAANLATRTICQRLNLCIDVTPPSVRRRRAPRPRVPTREISNMLTEMAKHDDSILYGHETKEGSIGQVTSSSTFTVVQLADIHINPSYAEGSATDCGLYVCCYSYYEGKGSAGRYGDYNCNVPERTFTLFLNKIKALNPRPDFILYTGDHPPHQMHNETYDFQLGCTRSLLSLLQRQMSDWKIYPNIGNHEMYPTNQFAMQELQDTRTMTAEFVNLWAPFAGFGDEQNATMNTAGYYTVLAKPGFRVLAFNTNYGYVMNFYNIINMDREEYSKQQMFMEDVLRNASLNGEKVIMLGHHPPGRSDTNYNWGRFYTKLVRRYKDVIALQLFGHTHSDHFNMITSPDGNTAEGVALVSPSISSSIGVNPSMRLFTFNDKFELQDYEQWYLDLGKAHANMSEPQIEKLYSPRTDYNMTDLTPASWLDLAKRLETDDALFAKFQKHFKANVSTNCNGSCRIERVCGLLTSSLDRYNACYNEKIRALTSAAPSVPTMASATQSKATTHDPMTTGHMTTRHRTTGCAPPVCNTRPPVGTGHSVAPSVTSIALLIFLLICM